MSVPYLSPATLIMVFSGTSLTSEQARLTECVNSPCEFQVHSLTSGNRRTLWYCILATVPETANTNERLMCGDIACPNYSAIFCN